MQQPPFLFSNERKYRLKRHVAFWVFWLLFQGFLYAFVPPLTVNYWRRIPQAMLDSFLFLPDHMFLSYSLMYFVIPACVVKSKYPAAAFWTFVLILATACLSSVIALYIAVPAREAILPAAFVFYNRSGGSGLFYLSVLAGLRGGLTVAGLAAAIKLMKHWYVEGQRNLQLQKEAIQSQLQVLKAQVHPHFLFNTLNNIYAHSQATAPTASKLVMGLSDMLRYMLYEGNQSLVPLAKELKMLGEYIGLENIRYGNELELHIDFPDEANGFSIAPLLLLPFVENAFKHGVSNVLDHPWLNLSVSLRETAMTFKLLNGKPEAPVPSRRGGIGIENVRKRLALLYPGKHELTVTDETDVFIVNLKLELERRPAVPANVAQAKAAAVA